MALKESIEKQGNWLFRRRSYLPLVMIPLLLAAIITANPKNFDPSGKMQYWGSICMAISFLGLVIRALTVAFVPKGTSGRNTAQQRADSLNTTGIYSVLRHPLYVGNFLIFLGFLLFVRSGWLILIGLVAYWIYYERIIFAEEEFLRRKFGTVFEEWSNKTPLIIPNFKNWQHPDLRFSFRNILRREYSGFFLIVACFTALKLLIPLLTAGSFKLHYSWIIFFFSGAAIYLILRTLKKKTRLLSVPGR